MHSDLRAAIEWLARSPGGPPGDASLLAEQLYPWYLHSTPLPEGDGPILPYECSLPAALRAAHAGVSRFEGGWHADAVSTWGRVVATKGDLSRILERGEYGVADKTGRRAEPGDALLVSACWDWLDEETGFWHARRGDWPPPGADRLVRTYWNCPPWTAPRLLAELTRGFDPVPEVPYMLKTAATHRHGGRADALIVYLGPQGFDLLEDELRRIASLAALELRPPRPRMSCELAPGVGLAEASVEGDSFGQVRCRLLAEAVCALPEPERGRPVAVERAVVEAFVSRGLDPERPYLEPEPRRDYG